MTDIVLTTGRRMTQMLADALNDITGSDREHAIQALSESASPTLGAVHRALALELRLCALREQDELRALEAGLRPSQDEMDAFPPLRKATGKAVFFDPESGEFSDLPPAA